LATIPEGADDLGYDLSNPMLLSTVPKSNEVPCCIVLSPVKSSKRLSNSSEYTGEEGFDSHMPGKQSKQLKVSQRRESPSSKTMKSWVAERVSWNGGRGCDATTEVGSGKNHNIWWDFEEQAVYVGSELGEHEELGCLGGMGNQEVELSGAKGNLSQLEVVVSPGKHLVQGIDVDLVWAVKGIAGMTWDGQEGKLKQVFRHIVADKYGEGASFSSGVNADGNMGMRDEHFSYEA
jgi:hypothetical protein